MSVKVQKWGNSLGVRIPGVFADTLGIDHGTEVEMHLDNKNGIIIRPKQEKPSLDDLLDKVTEENKHSEIDFGMEGNEKI